MEANQPSSSSSFTYDVFISFQPDDSGNGFASSLWKALNDKGICTFIDDQLLPKEPALLKVFSESRVAIIVLSENYASSSYCLDELAFILDNFQQNHNNRFIFPVFYNIDPSDVQRQSGTYGEAFSRHEAMFGGNNERVVKWRTALTQVANLSGWRYSHSDGYEFEFILKIVEAVSRKFNRVPLHNADYTVGLDSRLREVYPLLELESHEVLVVGIYGIGGIGKTTFAEAVYEKIADQFEASCFLSDIRESSNRYGLVHPQNMLLSEMTGWKDIQLRSASQGVSIIKHWLHRKKVLLILDDVDKLEQLEALVGGLDWFGSGSRVIITTRDKSLLKHFMGLREDTSYKS